MFRHVPRPRARRPEAMTLARRGKGWRSLTATLTDDRLRSATDAVGTVALAALRQ
jgi:hypothetical protein